MIWLENSIRFILLMALQVLLINNLHFMGVVAPCIYILFLLALPAELPRWVQLLIGFVTGLLMDICCNSLGVHMMACTMVCYLRPFLIGRLVQEDERLSGTVNSRSLGYEVYIKYLVLLTLVHHFMVFTLEAFTLHTFWLTMLQFVCSSLLTIVMLLSWEFIHNR